MNSVELSLLEARRLALACQGLNKKFPFGKGKKAIERAFERLSYIQIDTISVVERAHHHTLWSRMPNYDGQMLDELLAEKKIFEYWSHAAAYLPMRDYRFSLFRKDRLARGGSHWVRPDKKVMKAVKGRIKKEGPLRARDFKAIRKNTGGPWWEWKPAKEALERLFHEGELMVACRQGFEKVFDLTERVLPQEVDTTMPKFSEYARHLIDRAIEAHGFVTAEQIAYQRGAKTKEEVLKALKELIEEGSHQLLSIKGIDDKFYTKRELLESTSLRKWKPFLRILSPFDNSVIVRKRLEDLFDYEYRIECYTPKAKRLWGYFCLPLLWGTDFIGRLDGKAVRKDGRFIVENLYVEASKPYRASAKSTKSAGNLPLGLTLEVLADELQAFANFNKCPQVKLANISPKKLKKPLAKLFT